MEIIKRRSVLSEVQDGIGFEIPISDLVGTGKVGRQTVKTSDFFRNAKRKKRQENPISPNQADIVNWVLYDRSIFAAGTTVPAQFTLFSIPSGSGGKTNVDTNVTQVKRLEDPQWYNTTGVGFYFNPNVLPIDLFAFLNSEYMEFWVGQKTYLQGPLQCFPGAAGLTGFASTVANAVAPASGGYLVNGTANPMSYFDVRLPAGLGLGAQGMTDGLMGITILQGQAFFVNCYAPAGGAALSAAGGATLGTGLTIMAYLYGILSRSVQ